MAKFNKVEFIPENRDKYVGAYPIISRSSWELELMLFFDKNENVLEWASEPAKIVYYNPLKDKYTIYIPDFLVSFLDENDNIIIQMIEVKPKKEVAYVNAKNQRDREAALVNEAKWESAEMWCNERGIEFNIITEDELFVDGKRPSRRKT